MKVGALTVGPVADWDCQTVETARNMRQPSVIAAEPAPRLDLTLQPGATEGGNHQPPTPAVSDGGTDDPGSRDPLG